MEFLEPGGKVVAELTKPIIVQLRNRENRRREVQANCVFKDVNGISTGDETPWQTIILTENSTSM